MVFVSVSTVDHFFVALAMGAASEGNYKRARTYAHISMGFSMGGVFVTLVALIVLFTSI